MGLLEVNVSNSALCLHGLACGSRREEEAGFSVTGDPGWGQEQGAFKVPPGGQDPGAPRKRFPLA